MKKLVNQRFIDVINFIISENPKIKKGEIAKRLNLSSSTFSEILNKRMNVSIETISLLSKKFNFSLDYLINGEGDFFKKTTVEKEINVENKTPQVITVDENNEDNIVLVPVKAQAGYLDGYGDPEFIQQLPSYRLPNMQNGIFRMFQVEGFSMFPTLPQNSIVACQFVENWKYDVKDNRIYVIVTAEHGVVVKRCLNRIEKYGSIFCKSDNRKEYPSFSANLDEIREIWEVKIGLIHDLPDPTQLHDKVYDLEAEILNIKNILKIKSDKI